MRARPALRYHGGKWRLAPRLLATVLHGLKGAVVLSGYASDLYDELYGDWPHEDRASLADGARQRVERLWMSPKTAAMAAHSRMALVAP